MATIDRAPFERAVEALLIAALSAKDSRGLKIFVPHPDRQSVEMAVLGAVGCLCGFPVTLIDEVPVSFGLLPQQPTAG